MTLFLCGACVGTVIGWLIAGAVMSPAIDAMRQSTIQIDELLKRGNTPTRR